MTRAATCLPTRKQRFWQARVHKSNRYWVITTDDHWEFLGSHNSCKPQTTPMAEVIWGDGFGDILGSCHLMISWRPWVRLPRKSKFAPLMTAASPDSDGCWKFSVALSPLLDDSDKNILCSWWPQLQPTDSSVAPRKSVMSCCRIVRSAARSFLVVSERSQSFLERNMNYRHTTFEKTQVYWLRTSHRALGGACTSFVQSIARVLSESEMSQRSQVQEET